MSWVKGKKKGQNGGIRREGKKRGTPKKKAQHQVTLSSLKGGGCQEKAMRNLGA